MSNTMRRTLALPMMLFALACGNDSSVGPTPPPPPATKGSLKVVNNSSNSVMFIRAKACTNPGSWGPDILGSDILWQNESITRTMDPGCVNIRFTPSETGAGYLYANSVMIEAGKTKTITLTAFPAE